MEKINKKHHKLLALLFLVYSTAFTQASSSVENYNLLVRGNGLVWMPVVNYQANKGIYGEMRYNYEEAGAFSFNIGKTFFIPGKMRTNFTPMLGIVAGSMSGYNLAMKQETEWRDFYFTSESQYTFSSKIRSESFFYSWVESGYNISDKLFAGVSVQFTRMFQQEFVYNKGLVFGLSANRWTFPVYFFEPFSKKEFFVIGVIYKWQLKQTKRKISGKKQKQEQVIETTSIVASDY